MCIGFSSVLVFRWWLIASSSFPGGFSFRHTGPFTLHAFVRIPPPFCRSFQCGNAYSFVSLLHSSIHAGHFHQRVMAGYEFHFVSFIIETESDQCVHSNNHLLFSIHTRAHTRTYIPLFSDSLSLSLNYAPRFRYNCTTSQRVIQHWSTFLLFKWRFYWRSIWPHFFLPLIN